MNEPFDDAISNVQLAMLTSAFSVYSYISFTREPWNSWMHEKCQYVKDWEFESSKNPKIDIVDTLDNASKTVSEVVQETVEKAK